MTVENPVDPAHYKKPGGIEVIDFIEAICADLPGDEAALVMPLVKYISRYRQKHPENPVRDLKKGLWFLDRLIKMVEAKKVPGIALPPDPIPTWAPQKLPSATSIDDWAPQKLPEGTGVIVAKNRKEDEEANAAVFKTNTPRPGDVPGSRVRTKADTDGWRDDYSNKGKVVKTVYPMIRECRECKATALDGAPLHHWMSCSEYTGHF
jgi:hypothetical protein